MKLTVEYYNYTEYQFPINFQYTDSAYEQKSLYRVDNYSYNAIMQETELCGLFINVETFTFCFRFYHMSQKKLQSDFPHQ